MQLELATAARFIAPDRRVTVLAARDAALLAWLAVEGSTPRARLAQLLWPDSPVTAAGNALRQRLFQLRKSLGFEIVVGTVCLALAESVGHDLDESDGVLGSAAPAAGGEFAAWLDAQRSARRQRVQRLLTQRAQAAEDAHDWASAQHHAQQWLAAEPLSEAAHRRVIRLHYLMGDRAAALLAFDRCERMLKDEIGTTPSAETLALLATIERSAGVSLPTAASVPASVQRPPALVGRSTEQRLLDRAARDRAVVLLLGEGGIGKSRLIEECVGGTPTHGAARAWSVSARPGDAAVPYALAARCFRGLLRWPGVEADAALRAGLALVLPELGPLATDAAARADQRRRLDGAVETLLALCVKQGLEVLAIDDLHYADDASVELLQPLVGSAACGWILAMRPDELGAAATALVRAHGASGRALTVQLPALDGAAVAELLESLGIEGFGGTAQAQSLRRRTGGNPLFVLETLKLALSMRSAARSDAEAGAPNTQGRAALDWPRAEGVQRLIQQRLLRLTPLALKVARCAALAGADLSPPLVAKVLGQGVLDLADAWAELEAAQVLQGGAFAHDLIAEATLAQVPEAIAQALHAELAGVLEPADGEPVRIAAHWLAAGEPLRAVPHLTRAARRAHTAWQRGQAVDLHEQAAAILREAGDRRAAFDACFAAAEAASQLADRNRLRALGEALQALADDDGQRAAAALVPVFLLQEARQRDAARRLVLEALPRAQRAGLADIEVELLWDLVMFHMDRRELSDATRCAEQALQRLDAIDPATARLKHLGTRLKLGDALGTLLCSSGRYALGDAQLTQILALARRDGEWAYTGFIANRLAVSALEQGRLDRALEWSAQSIADDERYDGGLHQRVRVATQRSVVLALSGDLGGALESAERAVSLCGAIELRVELSARQRLHVLQFDLGRRDLALKGLRALRARKQLEAHERLLLDAELLRAGDRLGHAALLERAVAIDDFALQVRVLCLVRSGCEPASILPLLEASAATARERGAEGLWMALQTHRMAALRAGGRVDEAAALVLTVWQQVEDGVSSIEMFPTLATELCAALSATHAEPMRQIALRASAWMQRAAATLPAAWRDNYLLRAPMHDGLSPSVRGLLLVAPH